MSEQTLLRLSQAVCGNAVALAVVCLQLFSSQCCRPLFTLLPMPLSLVSTLTLCLVPLSLLFDLHADSVSMQQCLTKADCFFQLCSILYSASSSASAGRKLLTLSSTIKIRPN